MSAWAEDWQGVIHDTAQDIQVDLDSYNDDAQRSWITSRARYQSARNISVAGVKRDYVEKIAVLEFDCSRNQLRQREIRLNDGKGKLVLRQPDEKKFTGVMPGSSEEQLQGLVCQVRRMVRGN